MNTKNKIKNTLISIISVLICTVLSAKTVLADVAVDFAYEEVKEVNKSHIIIYISAIIVIITGIIILVREIKNKNIITIILSLLSIIVAVAFIILI